jgi:hypothetical protein
MQNKPRYIVRPDPPNPLEKGGPEQELISYIHL